MRNRFVVMLLAGSFFFAPAHSIAGDANIHLYGVGHVSADAVYNGDDTEGVAASNSSRFGVKGGINLGSELNAVIQYETGVDLTGRGANDGNGGSDSSGRLFTTSRDSFAGLHHSGFGELVAGRVGGLNQWVYDYNLFADQVGDLGNLWGGHGLFGRVNGSLQYTSPEFVGLKVRGLFASGEGAGGGDDVWMTKMDYRIKSLKAGLAYMNQGSATPDNQQAFACTAGYTFAGYSLGGGYQREIAASGIAGNDFDSVTLGGSAKLGPGVLKVQLGWVGEGAQNSTGAIQWAIGYDYNFSENTTIYVACSGVSNDDNASFSTNNYGHGQNVGAANPGDDLWAFSLGFVYKFDVNVRPR